MPIKKQITKCVTSSILQGKSILIKNMTYQEWQDWKAGEAAAGYENDDASTLKLENGFACFPDNDGLGEFYDIALVQRPLQHSSAAVTQALYWHWIAEN